MTTPNTEPIPATDAEIARVTKQAHDRGLYATWDMGTILPMAARIDQEREMRRELVKALSDEVSACSHLVEDPESCRRLICVISQRAIARAAKMEEDNAK